MEKFLHAVYVAAGSDRKIMRRWLDAFGSLGGWQYIWEKASFQELARAAEVAGPNEIVRRGTGEKFAERLVAMRRSFDASAEFARLWEKDIVIVSRDSVEYPETFLHFADAPFLLYRKGGALNSGSPCEERKIAVVGTRNPSRYGEKIAYDLAEKLAAQGVTVVSGLALGIDAIAHFAAVSLKKPTIAVLGSGLFDITPATHHRLAEKILEHGGSLLSEYLPSEPALPYRFLERNRIIAGMCEATVVIEAGAISGALATARLANGFGKDVFALAGDINRPQAQGCLQLIYDGAKPLVSIVKFLEDLKLSPQKSLLILTTQEQQLVDAFEGTPCSTDALIEKTLFPIQTINVLLTQLEFKGVIRRNQERIWEISTATPHISDFKRSKKIK